MRKLVPSLLFIVFLSMLSGSVFAGKVPVCEEMKGDLQALGLYGLCNAYYNAKNQTAKDRIRDNFYDIAPDGFYMPGEEPEEPEEPVVACPCWDYELLRQEIACVGYGYITSSTNEATYDSVLFLGSGNVINLFAGYTVFGFFSPDTECDAQVSAPGDFLNAPFARTDVDQDLACRDNILDLIQFPPAVGECVTD